MADARPLARARALVAVVAAAATLVAGAYLVAVSNPVSSQAKRAEELPAVESSTSYESPLSWLDISDSLR
jgi:hypothetical protein